MSLGHFDSAILGVDLLVKVGVTGAAACVMTPVFPNRVGTRRKSGPILIRILLHFDSAFIPNPEELDPGRSVTGEGSFDGKANLGRTAQTAASQPPAVWRSRLSVLGPFHFRTTEREALTAAVVLTHAFDLEVDPRQRIPHLNLNLRWLGARYPLAGPTVMVRRWMSEREKSPT
jgi:hypothetical protein